MSAETTPADAGIAAAQQEDTEDEYGPLVQVPLDVEDLLKGLLEEEYARGLEELTDVRHLSGAIGQRGLQLTFGDRVFNVVITRASGPESEAGHAD